MKKKREPKVTVDIKFDKATPAQLHAWDKFWKSVISNVHSKGKIRN